VVVAKPQPFFAIQLPVCVFLFGLSQQAGFLFCAVSSWGLWVRQFCLSRSDYSFALVGWTRHHLVLLSKHLGALKRWLICYQVALTKEM
jgi:hypothetical protein